MAVFTQHALHLRVLFQKMAQALQKDLQIARFCQQSELRDDQMFAALIRRTRKFGRVRTGNQAVSAFAKLGMSLPCPCQRFLGKLADQIGMFANNSFQPGGKAHAHPAFRQAGKDHRIMDFGYPWQAKFALQPITREMGRIGSAC